MPHSDKSIRQEHLPGADPELDGLCAMVRSILALSRPCPGETNPAMGNSNRVVVDVEVDGSRYLLIKTMPVDRRGAALSPREREIVRMVALGHPNKVIAAVLNISMWTVCTHLRRIFSKLDVSSRAAMVAKVTEVSLQRSPTTKSRQTDLRHSPAVSQRNPRETSTVDP